LTLRSPELRDAYAAVRQDKARQRKARKEAAREYVKTLVASKAPGKAPRVKDNTYLAWIRRLPCLAGMVTGLCSGSVQAAHIRYSDARYNRVNSGMQAKPSDLWVLPLCETHHLHDQHKRNERQFWSDLEIEPGEVCPSLHAAFLAGSDGLTVLERFTPAKKVRRAMEESQ